MAFVNIPHFLSVDKSQNFYIWAAKNVKMVDSSIDPKIAKFDFTQNLRGTKSQYFHTVECGHSTIVTVSYR